MNKRLLGYAMVLVFLMALVTLSPALGEQSSSPDPTNKSSDPKLQCGAQPNYGNQINFEGWVSGTVIDLQYHVSDGVKFGAAAGGPVTIARTNGARLPDGLILTGQPIFTGDVHASFWQGANQAYVTCVAATVGWNDVVGSVTLTAYDCGGTPVGSVTNTGTGVEFMSVSAPKIHSVIFTMGLDPAGSDIDCFTFDNPKLCTPPPPIPTLTEWGMIIFCVMLLGWMALVFIRRRKTANLSV